MYAPTGVKTSPDYPDPGHHEGLGAGRSRTAHRSRDKPVPVPKRAEVLVRIDAVAICATDLDIIYHGPPALIQGGLPFNKNWTPGHEYMGTVVALGPGVDEFAIGERVTVEIHAGCGQCKRCREGMYTSCLNYGLNYGDVDKGHRANGFTTDGGFCRVRGQPHQHAGPHRRRHVGRGGDAGRHRRHRDVRPDRARRAGRRRERGGDRPGPDRPARRRGRQGAGRAPGDPHRHARRPARDRPRARRRPRRQRPQGERGARPCAGSTAARASTT